VSETSSTQRAPHTRYDYAPPPRGASEAARAVSDGKARRAGRPIVTRVAALVIAALGFLPLVDWLPGNYQMPRDIQPAAWLYGTLVAAGIGVVLAILSRRIPWLWRDGAATALATQCERSPRLFAALVGGLALAAYALVAALVFDRRPLLIDEIAQLLQARIFAAGRLWLPAPAHPEFFSTLHVVDAGGRVYSQFPPGGPAVLAVGALLGGAWLVGPVCGALSAAVFALLVRGADERSGVRMGAALVFAFAPFTAFMAGSHMNHVPTLTCLLVATAATAAALSAHRPRPALAFVGGLGLGAAATIRPVDGLAFALPAGVWYLAAALRDRARWADALAAAAGIAVPSAAMMWVNLHTTGAPLRFGYEVLWGKGHELGFHAAPWGPPHTPARGLELVNLYFLRLQDYFLETPIPSLLPAVAALALARRLRPLDRYLLASGALLAALYFAYWHDGYFLGPRFLYPLLPLLALWTARALAELRERAGGTVGYRAAVYALAAAACIAAATSIPARARRYSGSFVTERWDAAGAARRAGVENALVLVRESWESQMVARLWALGVSHAQGEELYRNVDACQLDEAIAALERGTARGAAAYAALRPLLADSASVRVRRLAGGVTLRYAPGAPYAPRCVRRVAETEQGVVGLASLRLARDGNVYARDLHERDTLLFAEYPGRPAYLLRLSAPDPGGRPAFFPISRDSLLREWRAARL
jgi:hypothetical protein